MKYLILIIALISINAEAATRMIVAERQIDGQGNTYASVRIFKDNDGSYRDFKLTTAQALLKLSKLANKNITGLAKNSDRIIVNFKDGAVYSIEFQIRTESNAETFERTVIYPEAFTGQLNTDFNDFKAHVEGL